MFNEYSYVLSSYFQQLFVITTKKDALVQIRQLTRSRL